MAFRQRLFGGACLNSCGGSPLAMIHQVTAKIPEWRRRSATPVRVAQ